MISITRTIDREQQTVTWQVSEPTPPEHDINGVMCHAICDEIMTPENKEILSGLGYYLMDVDLHSLYAVTPFSLVYYVVKGDS